MMGCCESLLPDMIKALCGCQSTHLTSEPWPCRTLSSVAVTKSKMRTVRSSEHDVNLLSVGEKLFIIIKLIINHNNDRVRDVIWDYLRPLIFFRRVF